ncbi:uncharacterized protein SPPG_07854 [Spizellomyces punctatus DAOM BR117]|uniref:F-box protein Hrt3/FBXO9 C-terminal domain-containing protein n=1 Tax=Spizellomyces punctatus (strain DAOM BR117) TaxID=645134 RepID=A0A0L0H6Z6_SPIPD|nr:uncharacterized protein SPPG_07854 [Spizellomyces punctatus DAOM BR117]KNC96641.1 hypothetical protein SPPG_07854 [Spizellomyces punctatus DAOM BR117]|eukprot:XP_016604681.1 hypothetical protein SPPG_07854 [Spizellomyces punctatus DAOM BR117]
MDLQIPVVEEELVDFRQKWREEVSAKVAAAPYSTTSPASLSDKALERTPNATLQKSAASVAPPLASSSFAAMPSVAVGKLTQSSLVESISEQGKELPSEAEDPSLEAYLLGTKYERMGNLSAALTSYRDAVRLDPHVEQRFRKMLLQPSHPIHTHQEKESDPNSEFYTYYDFHEHTHTTHNDHANEITDLVERFQALDVAFMPHILDRKITLAKLPSEIVTQIIHWALLLHGHDTFCSLSLVSRKMLLLCREQSVWRFVCEKVHYPGMGFRSVAEELPLYKGNWFNMWLDRPRLRRDGLYISRVNYVRTGEAQSFYAPVHLVTYYRYLRFFPHKVVCWTTTVEPAKAVQVLLSDEVLQKGSMSGEYLLSSNHLYLHMRAHDRPGVSFKCNLTLASSRRGKHNKLKWVEYWQERDSDSSYRSDVPTRTLRTFYFSKVRSYPRSLL